ncbi:uncharacterized protein LOC121786381 [Salvia splendens]|uniref:uncharacterized protein LOC121786381 n=1 Tax=Salvia splendens TaxID=180675 RepID=UPI001C27DA91|nr:uncharacterized protein LOC121786381 [Salvia splendens]
MEQPRSSPQNHSTTNSPEFEFWMLRNPSLPQPNLPSADELFSGGFLLPLHLPAEPQPPPKPTAATQPESKRWRHLFKKSGGAVNNVVSAAELNINIWPFSRSRSAGSRPYAAARKASSAPCSRSNSAGESKSRRWAHSPNRAGVHLRRSSPVWQLRGGREKVAKRDGNYGLTKVGGSKARVLNLNVPTCIGYRNRLSCGYGEGRAAAGSGGGCGGSVSGEVIRRSHLFSIRSFFTKKVH